MIKYTIIIIIFTGCRMTTPLTETEIMSFVADNFIYESDINSEWETYEEIQIDYTGDCEDSVTLYLGLMYEHTGIKLNGVITQFVNGEYHANVRTDIVDYLLTPHDPTSEPGDHEVIKEFTYDEWMFLTWIM